MLPPTASCSRNPTKNLTVSPVRALSILNSTAVPSLKPRAHLSPRGLTVFLACTPQSTDAPLTERPSMRIARVSCAAKAATFAVLTGYCCHPFDFAAHAFLSQYPLSRSTSDMSRHRHPCLAHSTSTSSSASRSSSRKRAVVTQLALHSSDALVIGTGEAGCLHGMHDTGLVHMTASSFMNRVHCCCPCNSLYAEVY